MSPLCFRADHDLGKGWGWWLPCWVIPVPTALLVYESMQWDLQLHFKSFHSRERQQHPEPATSAPSCVSSASSAPHTIFGWWHHLHLRLRWPIRLCPKLSFFKAEKQNHNGIPHLDNDDVQCCRKCFRCHNSSFPCWMGSTNLQGSVFPSGVSKDLTVALCFHHCTTSYCQVQFVSLKWDLFSQPWAIWQISDWTKPPVQLFLLNARGLLVPVWGSSSALMYFSVRMRDWQ